MLNKFGHASRKPKIFYTIEPKDNPRIDYTERILFFTEAMTIKLKMFNAREKTSFNQVHGFNTSGLCSLHPVNLNDRKTLAVNFRTSLMWIIQQYLFNIFTSHIHPTSTG